MPFSEQVGYSNRFEEQPDANDYFSQAITASQQEGSLLGDKLKNLKHTHKNALEHALNMKGMSAMHFTGLEPRQNEQVNKLLEYLQMCQDGTAAEIAVQQIAKILDS